MSYRYFIKHLSTSFRVLLQKDNNDYSLLYLYVHDGRLTINIEWNHSEDIGKYETAIKGAFAQYLEQHRTDWKYIYVNIRDALLPDMVNSMVGMLLKSPASVPEVQSIELLPESADRPIPVSVFSAFLSVNNRTIIISTCAFHLLRLLEQTTDVRMYPRYVELYKESSYNMSPRNFMQMMPHYVYTPASNMRVVTYHGDCDPNTSTVVMMQYMRMKRQGLDLKAQPNALDWWAPQVRISPEQAKYIWVYDSDGIVTIDNDIMFAYSSPNVGMKPGTIMDMMTQQVEQLDGNVVLYKAKYRLEARGSRDWAYIELMAADYKTLGFVRLGSASDTSNRVREISLEKTVDKSNICYMYHVRIYVDKEDVMNAAISCTIDRSPPRDTSTVIDSDDGQGMDTGVRCARCMKQVLGVYR